VPHFMDSRKSSMAMRFAPGLVGAFQDSDGGGGRHRLPPPTRSEWRLGFDFPLPTSRSIGEPLALDATQDIAGTTGIVHAQGDPVVVSEIELGEVAMQMFLANVLVDAIDAAFQDGEETFCGVGVSVTAHVLISGMNDGLMAGECLADLPVDAALVSAQMRGFIDPGFKDRAKIRGIHFWHVSGADAACRSTSATTAFFGAGSR
jgi:hypothetical protein